MEPIDLANSLPPSNTSREVGREMSLSRLESTLLKRPSGCATAKVGRRMCQIGPSHPKLEKPAPVVALVTA